MKTVEEKAKAYNKALVIARSRYSIETEESVRICLELMFPELKESKDERIREALIRFHKSTIDIDGIKGDDIVAWLEKQGEQKDILEDAILDSNEDGLIAETIGVKQGEQKPTWSEEDEKMIEAALQFAHEYGRHGLWCWLKSLKDRVQPQPKQEWSEEDESLCRQIEGILSVCRTKSLLSFDLYKKMLDLLKSLRPQNWTKEDKERYISCLQRLGTGNPEQPETINSKWFKEHVYPQSTWKPSDEQMQALSIAMLGVNDPLFLLYQDLKKLRGE